jgi:hypothetical protein
MPGDALGIGKRAEFAARIDPSIPTEVAARRSVLSSRTFCDCPLPAHRGILCRRSNSLASGAKPTSGELRLQNWINERAAFSAISNRYKSTSWPAGLA